MTGQLMFKIKEKAEALEREGKNLIHFEIGDPEFNAPRKVKKACIKAIKQNKTHYVSSKGLYELREAISKKYKVPVSQVIIIPANFGIFLALSSMCKKGDEVVIPKPYFPTYKSVCQHLGLKIKYKVSKKTKVEIVNEPRNPTGEFDNKERLGKHPKIYDLVYREMIYDRDSQTEYGMKDGAVIMSFSKSHSMPGFRLGFMITGEKLLNKIDELVQTTISCLPEFIQVAGIEALKIKKYKIRELKKRRNLMVELLQQKGYDVEKPEGAIYCWVKVPNDVTFKKRKEVYYPKEVKRSGASFAEEALKRGVVICPGEAFGDKRYFRLCFARSIKDIEEGIMRLPHV